MCSRYLDALLVAACLFGAVSCRSTPTPRKAFKVCADPNNLPFSNQEGEGFENRIAEMIAGELNAKLEYTWFAQRRGFTRNTLGAGLCDVVLGVPHRLDPVETTRPYYRSTYVFVSREDRNLPIHSLDDDSLRHLTIGVHVIGDDYANPPPVHALGRRNIIHNVLGYTVFGDYSQPNPPARLIEAVAAGDVDIAIAWGPFGGYFGQRQPVPLRIVPVSEDSDHTGLPFAFDIAMGVRKHDIALRDKLEQVLDRRQQDIDRILLDYGVPLKQRVSTIAER